jgi:hypothetical protein
VTTTSSASAGPLSSRGTSARRPRSPRPPRRAAATGLRERAVLKVPRDKCLSRSTVTRARAPRRAARTTSGRRGATDGAELGHARRESKDNSILPHSLTPALIGPAVWAVKPWSAGPRATDRRRRRARSSPAPRPSPVAGASASATCPAAPSGRGP